MGLKCAEDVAGGKAVGGDVPLDSVEFAVDVKVTLDGAL